MPCFGMYIRTLNPYPKRFRGLGYRNLGLGFRVSHEAGSMCICSKMGQILRSPGGSFRTNPCVLGSSKKASLILGDPHMYGEYGEVIEEDLSLLR